MRSLWAWLPVLFYLIAESLLRITVGLSSPDPLGSFFVAAPIHVARAVRDAGRDARRAPKTSEHAFSTVRDTVRPWPGPEADLEVLSRLTKDHWTVHATQVVFRGTTYHVLDRQVLDEGVERHRFLLGTPEHETLARYVCEYEPEEVREIYRAQRRRDAGTWVETFALLWGLLDAKRQKRLAATYDYDPDRMTRRSIFLTVLMGGLAAVQGFVRLRGLGGPLDVVEFLGGLALLWESALRYRHYRAGRLRPSFLGVLVRPLADRFLRWSPTRYGRRTPAAS